MEIASQAVIDAAKKVDLPYKGFTDDKTLCLQSSSNQPLLWMAYREWVFFGITLAEVGAFSLFKSQEEAETHRDKCNAGTMGHPWRVRIVHISGS